jgi:hypothetical protein
MLDVSPATPAPILETGFEGGGEYFLEKIAPIAPVRIGAFRGALVGARGVREPDRRVSTQTTTHTAIRGVCVCVGGGQEIERAT